MIEEESIHKYRKQNGETPSYKAFHEVYITKDLGSKKSKEIADFITGHITGAKGYTEERHGIPVMLFKRKQDAQKFAKILSETFQIPKEHISIKAQKFTR
jgi:tRNA(Glu) U13 pseudouridine synthase TruD